MTDSNPAPESSNRPTRKDGTSPAPVSDPKRPKERVSRRPTLGPPVFGRYCWLIVVVPYVLYLVGTGGSGYLDTNRAHTAIGDQKNSRVLAGVKGLLASAGNSILDPESNQKLDQEVGVSAFVDAIAEVESPKPDATRQELDRILNHPSLVAAVKDKELLEKVRAEAKLYCDMLESYEKKHYRAILESAHQGNLQRTQGVDKVELEKAAEHKWFPGDRTWYPAIYSLTVIVTTIWVLMVGWGFFKAPFNFSWLSIVVGVVGIFVWIIPWWIDTHYLGWFATLDARAAFNPFEELKDHPEWMRQFLGIRFFGLVLLVPLIEEFFLRGFLMRYIDDPDWDQIPLATMGKWTLLGILIYAGMSHPSELPSALLWFGMMTWLYLRTKSIWNCVIAHGITNLLLAVYVIYTETWSLW